MFQLSSRCASPRTRYLVLIALLLLGVAQMPPLAQADDSITVVAPTPGDTSVAVLIELRAAPTSKVYAETLATTTLAPERAASAALLATQAQMRVITQQQQNLATILARAPFGATEIYRVQRVMNAIAVRIDGAQLEALRQLPGVKSIQPLTLEYPTTSVPFIGAPQLWNNSLGLGLNLTGSGVKIGVIDTGIDYQHAMFGGTGLLADYQANDRTTNADGLFPTVKVVGGTDFAGDAYNGANAPSPDPDPMDCNGHGTHVAGTAAGLGVQSDGTTYPGPYDPSTPFGTLRISPGVAPAAQLYALRVFGCSGGTGLTIQAIEWAMDPNGDSNFADHLDVLNLSLGSSFGGPASATTIAAENAARAGVIVVASAGNSGDTYFITGSPGTSSSTISVAAVADDSIPGTLLHVNTPAAITGDYVAGAVNTFAPTPAPAPSGQTASIILAIDPADGAGPLTTDGCSALTNAAAIAGNIALIDRGTCGFQVKAANAQAAGAIGVIIVNNVVGDPYPFAMGPTGVTQITIPAIAISLADGTTIKAQLGSGVNATLATANAGDTIASFSSRGPRLGSPTVLKPDIAAPGVNIVSAQTGVTCASGCQRVDPSGYLPGSQALTLSGTSMASPHMAGTMALLRQQHPSWTVEELKALAMNGAIHDVTIGANGSGFKFSPSRIGAGRVDPVNSAQNQVVAFNADDAGQVSVVFDPEIVGVSTQIKRIRLVNKGLVAATYDLAISSILSAPGVSFSLPGGSTITVPAQQSVTIDIQLSANASLMDHSKDPTVVSTQTAPAPLTVLGNLSRHWLTESAGYVTFSTGGQPKLRVPVYVAPRPASTMQASSTLITGGAPTGSTTLALSGADVCTGTLAAGPTCTGTFPTNEVSLVTPFELQAVHARDTNLPDYANVQYAGVAYDPANNLLLFGLSTWGDWSSPTDVAFNIYIDNNSDSTYDRILFNSNPGTMSSSLFGAGSAAQDSFITTIFTIATSGVATSTSYVNRLSAATVDSALLRNNVMFLAATPAQLGLAVGTTNFRYRIETCPGNAPLCGRSGGFHYDSLSGPFSWNYAAQGLNFGGTNLAQDLNGSTLPVTWNLANLTANGSLGALLLHHHNRQGTRAQLVPLDSAPSTDIALTHSVAPSTPNLGQNVTLTLTATNTGPDAASGVVVNDLLPPGLTYVSDDGGGAYTSSTGDWAAGTLAIGASATLNIVATVATTDKIVTTAQLSAVAPLDTNATNDRASVTLNAPRQSDLRVTMTASPTTMVVGESATYTMTVTNLGDDPAYNLTPSQTFPAGGVAINSYTVTHGVFDPGTGVWTIASLGKGFSETLTVNVTSITSGALTNTGILTLAGDLNTANNSASATVTVNKRTTIASVALAPPTIGFGQSSSATITVTDTEALGLISNPAGTVTLSDAISGTSFIPSATCTLVPSSAATNQSSCQISVAPGPLGAHTITATYSGSAIHLPATNSGTVVVNALPGTTTTISGHTPSPSLIGQPVTISFSVAPLALAALSPTGTVTVSDGQLSCTATVAAGQCILVFSSVGTYTLTASYAGDANFNGSNSAAVSHQVTAVETPQPHMVYLPVVERQGTPDLIVGRIELFPARTTFAAGEPVELKVTVTNTGTAAAGPFWIDLSINPALPPTIANQLWNTQCSLSPCFGMAWRVVNGLAPGTSITLTSKELLPGYSTWPGWLAAGTTDLYAYADSYNPGVAAGAVAEQDESNNQLHVSGITVVGSNPLLQQVQSGNNLRTRPLSPPK